MISNRNSSTSALAPAAISTSAAAVYLATALIAGAAVCSCGGTELHPTEGSKVSTTEGTTMSITEANKAFMRKLFSGKSTLDDFPDRVDSNLIVYQPASLPFGGTYHGLAEFRQAWPKMGAYYDFSRAEFLGLYGDGDTVFASIKVGLAGSQSSVFLAEEFTFHGTKLVEVRAHVCEPK
jgi:hypothetical protein